MKKARLSALSLHRRRIRRKIDVKLAELGYPTGSDWVIAAYTFPWYLVTDIEGDQLVIKTPLIENQAFTNGAEAEAHVDALLAAMPNAQDYKDAGAMDKLLQKQYGPWRADIRPHVVLGQPGRFILRIRLSDNFRDGPHDRHEVICDTLYDLKCAVVYLNNCWPKDWQGQRQKWFKSEKSPFYDFDLPIEGQRAFAESLNQKVA